MAITHLPRIVGFEVPPLKADVDTIRDAPIVALLDAVPDADWVREFETAVRSLQGPLGLAEVTIEHDKLLFFGAEGQGRRMADAVRGLVDRVSRLHIDARFGGALPQRLPTRPVSPRQGMGTVLVVEDDAVLRAVAEDALTESGWAAVEADNAAQAIALLEQSATRFDVVFTDVDMPGAMGGIGLAHHVRARYPDMALMVTSGRYTLDAGRLPPGCAFLSKPYQRRQLLALLDLTARQDNDTPASPIP